MRSIYLLMTACVLMASCDTPRTLPPSDYLNWLSKHAQDLSKERRIKNVTLKTQFLPADFLAYKEFKKGDSDNYDSILSAYKDNLTFHVTVQAERNDPAYSNLMYYHIGNENDYLVRARYLSFNIQDFITLRHKETNYEPMLSHFEGYDPVGNKLSFQVVYTVPEYKATVRTTQFDDIVITFDDPYFDLGTVNFEFGKKNIAEIPEIKI